MTSPGERCWRRLVLMIADGCRQRREAAETTGSRLRLRLRVPRPGEVHLREGAVVNGENHIIAAAALDDCRELTSCQLVMRADLGLSLGRKRCRELRFWPVQVAVLILGASQILPVADGDQAPGLDPAGSRVGLKGVQR